jgi:SAM-dependent methyltransferase
MDRNRVELVLASFLMLFVELVLIRWAGAFVVHLSYFANFVLLGSFLGIGIGFLRARRGPDLFTWAPTVLAVFLGLLMAFPASIDRTGDDLVYFGVQETGLPAWILLPFVFLATAACLATIAHGVATRFARFEALEAYRLDILGSLSGIAAFAIFAFVGWGPLAWAVVIGGLFVAILRRPSLLHVASLAAIAALFAIGTFRADTIWSPYYRLVVRDLPNDLIAISANGVAHQAAASTAGSDYELIYDRLREVPERVLIVGAGNGNDVSVALRMGAGSVDAVEIDPELLAIGIDRHPERPYDDPRVRRIVDDGRAFLERTDRTYDMILFALPDSLTLVSGQSSVRLESYLFTRQAVESAAEHLAEDGVFVMYNFYREQWLADRLAGTLRTVFGQPPCTDLGTDQGGEVGQLSIFVASADPASLACGTVWDPEGREVVAPATDDHPFVYLRERTIPGRYLAAILLILVGSAALVRATGSSFRPMGRYLDLFFMGAAFLLLETKSVVQFALLFGTTWFVNALVFFGVLLSVYVAIEVERRFRIGRPLLLFGVLFVGLLVAGVVPVSWLLSLPTVPRFLVATALAFFPIFAANLIFAERFRDTADPPAAFGANLLGAMAGGTLEYLSLVTGYRGLLVVAALLYALAWLAMPRRAGGDAVATPPASAVPVGASRD